MIALHPNHVDRTRSEITCDKILGLDEKCPQRQCLPADETSWAAFMERTGWVSHPDLNPARGMHVCPFCAASIAPLVAFCECRLKYPSARVFEVYRASATDTRYMCKHCDGWTGTHDPDPPYERGMRR